jgi:acyl-CoA synthetase (AMP-forming)/AMP-acid ligase II
VEADDRLTVPALIRRWSREQPDKPFVVADDGVLTYGELDRATTTIATHLARDGIVKGTRVGVLMPNSIAWVLAAMAASRIGAVLVPLSTLLPPAELEAQLRVAAVEHLLLAEISPALTPRARPRFDHALPRLRSVDVWDEWLASNADGDGAVITGTVDALEHSVRPADDLAIIFTSGSRGTSKGVIHTHAGALAATAAGLEVRCLTRDDRLDNSMPFFGIDGFGTGLLSVLVAGATLVTGAQPEPSHTVQRASPLGMTETFGWYCGERLDRDLPPSKEESCGRAFPGVELRVVDPDTGAVVGTGTVGEIQVRSRNLMRGICGCLHAEIFTVDGFLPTGDLGVVDDDGYIFFRGRLLTGG